MQIFGDSMVFETKEHCDAFRSACRQLNISMRGVKLIAADGRGGFGLAGPGTESAGDTASRYRCVRKSGMQCI